MTQKEEFDQILDIFTNPGWKYILEDIIERKKAIDNCYDVNTVEELYKRKGELDTLNWFLSLKEWYQYSQEMYESNEDI